MPRIEPELQRLQEIKTLPSLIKYLKDDLNWPIGSDDVESVVFDYDPAELGFDSASTAKIEEVCQLRPLTPGQKWGVFWVKFGKKQLPVQMLRRALGNLVVKKRTSTKKSDKAAWHMHDLLFISAYGDDSNRHITFAHFSESEDSEKSLPVLKVLSWDEDDTLLHLKDTYKTLVTCLNWETTPTDDPEAWREHWSKAFKLTHKEVINTTKELVVELAQLATVIKKSVLTSIKAETEKGPWRKLMLAFQKTLIKDLDEDQFADVIAQTVSYGLLTARLSSDGQISLKNLVDMVPSTNPFLKELLQHFLTSAGMKGLFDVDEAGINDVVELLNRANAQAIRNDFGRKTDGEDPVIHFYEHFLGAYNKKLKVQRGVFYTPKPVVSYIVRNVHELLQKEFGLVDGLADTSTWAEVKSKHNSLKIPENIKDPKIEPFVQILDPATGTATFLIEVIDVIHNTMVAKWEKERVSKAEQTKKWNTYVPTHLLPRLYAYELMMAPYAIAHMKVGLKLAETGFTAWDKLGPESRANIFLTNALEPWEKQSDLPGFSALAQESAAVNEVKKNRYFTVVTGNPPYSNFGQLNKNSFILGLLDEYKVGLNERKINLDDDFIKFMRLGQHVIDRSGAGIVGLITSNTFLDGLTHRQMRHSLMCSFSSVRINNLHGNIRKKEKGPLGTPDENVFEIQQGVSISFLSRRPYDAKHSTCSVETKDTWGDRSLKYALLQKGMDDLGDFKIIANTAPYWLFVGQDTSMLEEYKTHLELIEVFSSFSSGIQTKRDSLTIQHTNAEILEVKNDLLTKTAQEIRAKYDLPEDGRDWTMEDAIADITRNSPRIVEVLYRPFDIRKTLWTGKTKGFLGYPRTDTMKHMLSPNIGLCIKRQMQNLDWSYIFASKHMVESAVHFSTPSNPHFFPLYFYDHDKDEQGLFRGHGQPRRHNLGGKILDSVRNKYHLACGTKARGDLDTNFGPEDILCHIYAILHSPTYRRRYAEFLKMDFPRIPMPASISLFRKLCVLGSDLLSLHLLEGKKTLPVTAIATCKVGQVVDKASWSECTVFVDKNKTVGFKGVKEEVWNFQIGGYQVCDKWLKDRKGRNLTKDDIEHYQKIVVALSETIRLMAEIDKVIDEHGGWPGAFQATN